MKTFRKLFLVAGVIGIGCFGYGFYRYQKAHQSAVILTQSVISDYISKNHPDEALRNDLLGFSDAIKHQWSWRAWDIDLSVLNVLRSGTLTNEQAAMIHEAVGLVEQNDLSEEQRKSFQEKYKNVTREFR